MNKTKEFLLEIRKIETLISSKLEEVVYWETIATSTTIYSEGDRVQSSGSQQKMENAICECADIKAEIKEEIDRLKKRRSEIISTIEKLKNEEYLVLHRAYVLHWDFTKIAEEFDKSYSSITTTHGRALVNLQKILDEMGVNNDE